MAAVVPRLVSWTLTPANTVLPTLISFRQFYIVTVIYKTMQYNTLSTCIPRHGAAYVNSLQTRCQMSKTFIGAAVCREFKSEAAAAEEMLDRVVCSSEQFSFALKVVTVAELFITEDRELQTAGAVILNDLD